jgi:PAS domain S-box-containing protein
MVADDMRVLKEGKPIEIEEEMNGRLYSTIKFPIHRQGKPTYLAGFTVDITERKQAEELLHTSEEKYRLLVENANEAIVVAQDGMLKFVNRMAIDLTGYSEQELTSRPFPEFIHPDDRGMVVEHYLRRIKGDVSEPRYVFRLMARDGSIKWLEISAVLIDWQGKPATLNFFSDVTARKRAEEALGKSEEAAKRLAQENGVMAEIGRIISSTLNIEEVYERFAAEVCKLIPFDRIMVALNNLEEDTATVTYASGLEFEGRRIGDVYPIAHSGHEEVVRTRAGLLVQPEAVEELEGRFSTLISTFRAGLRSIMSVPLISRGQVIGALHLRSKKSKAYTDRDLKLAERIGAQIAGAIANVQLFLERKRVEEKLRESEQRYRLLIETASEGILVAQGANLKFVNPMILELTGHTEEELLSFPFLELVHPDDRELARNNYLRRLKGEVVDSRYHLRILKNDKTIIWIEMSGVKIEWEGQPATLNFVTDITARKRAEDALRESETLLSEITSKVPGVVYQFYARPNGEFGVYYVSDRSERAIGLKPDLEGYFERFIALVIPEHRDDFRTSIEKSVKESSEWKYEGMLQKPSGEKIWFSANSTPSRHQNELVFNGIVHDITERKEAEEKIRASLKEKEVLLKEIHHRVKNNLQIISSLLSLQSARTEHPEAVSVLRESRNRIRSMALIHERLYQSPNLASVDMLKYTTNLVSDLQRSYRPKDSSVRLTVTVEDIPLGITEAIPCGLIINELVSNGLKHAFPKGREGELTIQLQRGSANQITLTVSDNGIGLPESVDFRNSPSLGLTLINSLVEQLDGTIELDRRGGTVFTITFKASS